MKIVPCIFQTEAERLAAIPDQAGREMEIEAALGQFYARGFETNQDCVELVKAALTPSADTKAAYICEFSVPHPYIDEDGNEVQGRINVPWVTIKEIMARIRQQAGLGQ